MVIIEKPFHISAEKCVLMHVMGTFIIDKPFIVNKIKTKLSWCNILLNFKCGSSKNSMLQIFIIAVSWGFSKRYDQSTACG